MDNSTIDTKVLELIEKINDCRLNSKNLQEYLIRALPYKEQLIKLMEEYKTEEYGK